MRLQVLRLLTLLFVVGKLTDLVRGLPKLNFSHLLHLTSSEKGMIFFVHRAQSPPASLAWLICGPQTFARETQANHFMHKFHFRFICFAKRIIECVQITPQVSILTPVCAVGSPSRTGHRYPASRSPVARVASLSLQVVAANLFKLIEVTKSINQRIIIVRLG